MSAHGRRFCTMAFPSADCRRSPDSRATRPVAGSVCLSATLRQRLLFQPVAQPFSAALRLRTQGRSDRPLGRYQPAHGLAPARSLFQGGDSGCAPPHGGSAPRQAAAALCRPHRRVHPDPCRRHPLRHPRLHPTHLGRARLHGGLAPLLQEVRPRSRHARRGNSRAPERGAHACRSRDSRPVETMPAGATPPPPFSRRGPSTRGRSC